MRALLTIAVLSLLPAAGCGPNDDGRNTTSTEEPAQDASTSDPRDEDLPRFDAPDGWVREAPETSLRLHQFRLPGVGGAPDGEVRVFSWPTGVGTLEDNLLRWADQMGLREVPDGSRSERVVRDFDVTMVDYSGAFTEMGSTEAVPVSRMLAAFIERPISAHAWTVVAVGPEATMARWKDSFDAFIQGL